MQTNFIPRSICLSVCLTVCLSGWLSGWLAGRLRSVLSIGMFWLDGAQIGSYVFESVDNPSIGFKGVSMNPIVPGNECGIEGQLLDNGQRLHLWAGSSYNGSHCET